MINIIYGFRDLLYSILNIFLVYKKIIFKIYQFTILKILYLKYLKQDLGTHLLLSPYPIHLNCSTSQPPTPTPIVIATTPPTNSSLAIISSHQQLPSSHSIPKFGTPSAWHLTLPPLPKVWGWMSLTHRHRFLSCVTKKFC